MFSKSITVLLCYAKQYEMQRDAACNLFKMSHHISMIAVKEGKHGSGWNNIFVRMTRWGLKTHEVTNYKTTKRFKLKYDFSSPQRVKSEVAIATCLYKSTLVKLKTHQFEYS